VLPYREWPSSPVKHAVVRPIGEIEDRKPRGSTLAYARQLGLQFTYQVEEQKVAVEILGEGEQQRILIWQAAEGGTGIFERLVIEPHGFAQIGREALDVCHYDPDRGEKLRGVERRCPAGATGA
jgi:hypothetical protein